MSLTRGHALRRCCCCPMRWRPISTCGRRRHEHCRATIARWLTADMLATRQAEVEPVRLMIANTPVAGYVGCCAALKTFACRERLGAPRLPALFIAGAQDPAVPVATMVDMHGRVAGSHYVQLPAAHLSNIECAAPCNAALTDFLHAYA